MASSNPFDQFIQQQEVSLEQQQEIKDEILDFDIFDLLQKEEPEMACLMDQASSSFDSILASPSSSLNYLPQISANTATKVLDNLVATHHHHHHMMETHSNSSLSSMLLELSRTSGNEVDTSNGQKQPAPALFKLDDEMPTTSSGSMGPSSSFKELCDLLSISKHKPTMTLTKLKLTDDILPSTSSVSSPLNPSRTSMRLIQKSRKIKKELTDDTLPSTSSVSSPLNASRTSMRLIQKSRKIKKEFEKKIQMDVSTLYTSNDQSDDEDEDDEDDIESDDSSSMGGEMKQRSSARTDRKNWLNPVKKESNKEAATRYRLKKISEKDKLFETRFNLEKENDSKRRQIELVQTEINYLKTILVQFILTKSCMNK